MSNYNSIRYDEFGNRRPLPIFASQDTRHRPDQGPSGSRNGGGEDGSWVRLLPSTDYGLPSTTTDPRSRVPSALPTTFKPYDQVPLHTHLNPQLNPVAFALSPSAVPAFQSTTQGSYIPERPASRSAFEFLHSNEPSVPQRKESRSSWPEQSTSSRPPSLYAIRRTFPNDKTKRHSPPSKRSRSRFSPNHRKPSHLVSSTGRNIMPRHTRFEPASSSDSGALATESSDEDEAAADGRLIAFRPSRRDTRGRDPADPVDLDDDDAVVDLAEEEPASEEAPRVLKALTLICPRKEELRRFRRPFSSKDPALCLYVGAVYPHILDIDEGKDLESSFSVHFRDWEKQLSGFDVPHNDRPKDLTQNHKIPAAQRNIPAEMFGILAGLKALSATSLSGGNVQVFVKARSTRQWWRGFVLSLSDDGRRGDFLIGTSGPLHTILDILQENKLNMDVDLPRLDSETMCQAQFAASRTWSFGVPAVGPLPSDLNDFGPGLWVFVAAQAGGGVAVGFSNTDVLSSEAAAAPLRKTFMTTLRPGMVARGSPAEWLGLREALRRVGQTSVRLLVLTTSPRLVLEWRCARLWTGELREARPWAAQMREAVGANLLRLQLIDTEDAAEEGSTMETWITRMKEIQKLLTHNDLSTK